MCEMAGGMIARKRERKMKHRGRRVRTWKGGGLAGLGEKEDSEERRWKRKGGI